MSKKTKQEKHKRILKAQARHKTRPRRRIHLRRNPLKIKRENQPKPELFADPVFLHHFASAVLRYLELKYPAELQIIKTVDADFTPPTDPKEPIQ